MTPVEFVHEAAHRRDSLKRVGPLREPVPGLSIAELRVVRA